MSPSRAIVIPPSTARWGDAWAHPEYFAGVTLKRVIAYAIDVVVVGLLAIALWFVASFLVVLSLGLLLPLKALALALLPLAYHILLLASPRAATVGMRLMGLRVMSLAPGAEAWGGRPTLFQAMIQIVAFYGSVALTGSLILLVALFNPRRRTLHDWLAGTVVVNDLSFRQDAG
ncbi:MAG: RDD family protein [Magnetospirillum sp.]|nr:RDD family protein [Magnetospirillum sp.]